MNENTANQGQEHPPKGNEPERVGPDGADRDTADDQGTNWRPDDREPSIPELDEPEDEGITRDRTTDATMPPGEGQDPKRNTL